MLVTAYPSRIGSAIALGDGVNRAHSLSRGRIAWWLALPGRMSGRRWYDLAGSNHGTLTNGPTWGGTARPGGSGEVRFDGSNDHVTIPDAPSLRPASITVAASFRLASTPNFSAVACKPYVAAPWTPPYLSWLLRINNANQVEFSVGNGSGYSGSAGAFGLTTPLVTGRWYHVAGTYDGSTIRAYLDAVAIGTGSYAGGAIGYASQPVLIGADHGSSPLGDYFPGQVDGVAIVDHAWSASEVRADYDLSRQGYPGVLNRVGTAAWMAGAVAPPPADNPESLLMCM